MMKKHGIFTGIVMLILIAIFTAIISCSNFGIPETVEIKTNARYALNMGFDILDMSEYLSPETLSKSFPNNSKLNVYDYNPGGTAPVKHFLIEYHAINQSIDISKHFDNLDFGTEVDNAMGFDESFKVDPIDLKPRFGPLSAMYTTFSLDDPAHPLTVRIGDLGSANLTKAEIKTGRIILSIPKPAGWDNSITATVQSGTIELDGGIKHRYNVGAQGSTDPNYLLYKEIDLNGREFTPSPVELKGTIELIGGTQNKDFYFTLDLEVTEYESVTVDIGKVNTTFNFNKALPSELSNFVKSINCNEVGIAFKYKNNLPNANNVEIKVTSPFLGISPQVSKTLVSDNSVHSEKISNANKTLDLTNTNNIDITVELTLPNAQKAGNDTLITVNNITAGQTYSLSLTDFKFILDWTAITVDSSNLNQNDKTVDLPIDFNSMFDNIKNSVSGLGNFVSNLQVDNIPVYMYVSKPENGFSNLGMTVSKLKMLGSSGLDKDLLNGQQLQMTARSLPNLESGKTVRTDFSKLTYLTSLDSAAFKDIINNRNDSLKLNYDISLTNGASSLTINKTDVDNMKKNGGALDIKAAVYIDIPLKLTLKNGTSINLMSMAGMDANSDLMGRSEPLSLGEYENYMNGIKSVELMLNLQNGVFFDGGSGKINFVIDDKTGGGKNILGKKEYQLSNLIIGFTTDETKQILKSAPPYMPDIKIDFPQGSGFQIPQTGGQLGFSGKVAITTDGSIFIGGK